MDRIVVWCTGSQEEIKRLCPRSDFAVILSCVLDYSWPYCVVTRKGQNSKDIIGHSLSIDFENVIYFSPAPYLQKSVFDSKKNVTVSDLWLSAFEFHLFTYKGQWKFQF